MVRRTGYPPPRPKLHQQKSVMVGELRIPRKVNNHLRIWNVQCQVISHAGYFLPFPTKWDGLVGPTDPVLRNLITEVGGVSESLEPPPVSVWSKICGRSFRDLVSHEKARSNVKINRIRKNQKFPFALRSWCPSHRSTSSEYPAINRCALCTSACKTATSSANRWPSSSCRWSCQADRRKWLKTHPRCTQWTSNIRAQKKALRMADFWGSKSFIQTNSASWQYQTSIHLRELQNPICFFCVIIYRTSHTLYKYTIYDPPTIQYHLVFQISQE